MEFTWKDVQKLAKTRITKIAVKEAYLAIHPEAKFELFNDYLDAFMKLYPGNDEVSTLRHPPPIKRTTIPKAIRIKVWENTYGENYRVKCLVCENSMTCMDGWEASHILASSKGGSSDESNLRPLCRQCNNSMREMHMFDYICTYYGKERLRIILALRIDKP